MPTAQADCVSVAHTFLLTLALGCAGCTFEPPGLPPDDNPPGQPGQPDPGATATLFRQPLALTVTPSAEDLTDFPILVVLDSERFDYTKSADDGSDIYFEDQHGNRLAHEIELWNPAGQSFLWVKTDILLASDDNQINLYYGAAPTGQDLPAQSVWSDDYRAVWHLAEDVANDQKMTGVHDDATGRGNVGDQNGNHMVGAAVAAIGRAQAFEGSSDKREFIEISPSGLELTGSTITISARAYIEVEYAEFPHVVGAGSGGRHWQLWWRPEQNGWGARYRLNQGNANLFTADLDQLGRWIDIALVYDGQVARMYVNGVSQTSVEVAGALDPIDSPFRIGDNPTLPNRQFNGYIDEVRIAAVARSAEWMLLQHVSLNDGLLDYGAPVEPVPTE